MLVLKIFLGICCNHFIERKYAYAQVSTMYGASAVLPAVLNSPHHDKSFSSNGELSTTFVSSSVTSHHDRHSDSSSELKSSSISIKKSLKSISTVLVSTSSLELSSSTSQRMKSMLFSSSVSSNSATNFGSSIISLVSSSRLISSHVLSSHTRSSKENVKNATSVRIFSSSRSSSMQSSSTKSSVVISNSSTVFLSSLNPSCTTTTIIMCSSPVLLSTHSIVPLIPISIVTTSQSMKVNYSSSMNLQTSTLAALPTITSSIPPSSKMHSSSSDILVTSVKVENISSAASVHYSSAIPINPPMEQCEGVILTFSEAVSNFTQCVLQNVHHMSVCRKCVKPYDALQDLHKELFKNCGVTLIDSYNENYQVVPKILDAQTRTWDDLGCEKCIDRSSGTSLLTKPFQEFLQLYHLTMECFRNNTYKPQPRIPAKNSTHPANDTDSKKVCVKCDSYYKKMQENFKYYEDSEEETSTPWCADINVAVNETRHMWGSQFKCGRAQKDLESIIALTCFFCFLPIVFYVGAKLHSEVKERKTNRYYESE